MSVRIEFEKELIEIHKDLINMESIIECSLKMTLEAIEKKDLKIAESVIQRDDLVDSLESKIEKECINIICKQQPVAKDLRNITAILKMITDLERIADHCADICEFVIKIAYKKNDLFFSDIQKMGNHVTSMLKKTIECYIDKDYEKAVMTSKEDDIIDDYFEKITEEIKVSMLENQNNIPSGIYFLFIIKYFERMADHITNVCEWIAYKITGIHDSYN